MIKPLLKRSLYH